MFALTVLDTTPSGHALHRMVLHVPVELVSVREIIQQRVSQEVDAHNREEMAESFRGLVQPTGAQPTGDGYHYRLKARRRINAQEQIELACRAFERNGFFMLIDDRQVDSLDEEIDLTGETTVSFVKLLPLVGG